MRQFCLLAMPVRDVPLMSALEHANCQTWGCTLSSQSKEKLWFSVHHSILFLSTKTSLKFCNSSSYLFCVFFLQGGTSSYLGSGNNKQSKSSQIDTCPNPKGSEVQFCFLYCQITHTSAHSITAWLQPVFYSKLHQHTNILSISIQTHFLLYLHSKTQVVPQQLVAKDFQGKQLDLILHAVTAHQQCKDNGQQLPTAEEIRAT